MAIAEKDVWLITGCSSGLGKALAEYTYKAGSLVVATARKPETLSYLPDTPNVLKLCLDVTSKEQVAQVVQATVDRFGCLDVVVNNAGYGVTGDTEVLPDADARAQFETNFWGAVNVTKAALPILREVNPPGKGGLFIQISSVGGRVCYAGSAYYHASKFALEGFTDALAKEMHPNWNIKFTMIELGAVATNFPQNMVLPPRHPAYEDPACGYNAVRAYLTSASNAVQWNDAAVCARVLHDLACKRNDITPPVRLALGADSWAVVKAELEGIMKEHETWKAVAESTSHAENQRATEFLLKSVR
ncbi:hypothetical protein Z517_06149 [Fonsecaea pedrosoi CBS 271.37]|uniref:Uncharacterized protein n=1 Tax=Fonsecaea pedrosoi CBS 271.37 TaxID=1442368 RepID=A0A0D2EZ23_9EURO|nr:uncharacterized protein Z517_06149 [Fonsecaea pedrosoi CBS 271.37]KIW79537.1 hypothetical protein Z517_06149 [Fonsecaea pedrosoi CBS 271.37]